MNSGNQLRCITFYSYKGGVGRSMALANVALDLAVRNGKKVLVIDWDLDAPGLHYYFGISDAHLKYQKGLVDYLDDGAELLESGGASSFELSDYTIKNVFRTEGKRGNVDLMTCGKRDGEFLGRVTSINWETFYEQRGGYAVVESLRRKALQEYDIVLVDARSGGAETAVLATLHMPDLVVMLFAANSQSLQGTVDIAWRLKNNPARKHWQRPPLRFVFVPARVFATSARFSEWLSAEAATASSQLENMGLLERQLQPRGFAQFLLNVEPEASVGETLLLNLPNGGDLALNKAYLNLSDLIGQLYRGDVDWRSEPFVPFSFIADEASELRRELQETVGRGDENTAHLLRLFLGRLLLRADNLGQLSQVSAMLPSTLTHFQNRGDIRNAAVSCLLLGQTELRLGNIDLAEVYIREGLLLMETLREPLGEAVLRHELGQILRRKAERGDVSYEKAEAELARSLNIKEALGDYQEAAHTLREIGALEFDRGQFDRARSHFERSLKYSEVDENSRGMASAYYSLGNLYGQQNLPEEALKYFEIALHMQDAKSNPQGHSLTLLRMGDCYRSIATGAPSDRAKFYYEQALDQYRASLGIAVLLNDLQNVQALHIKIGETYRETGDLEAAALSFQQALAVGRIEQHPGGLADVYVRLAEIELATGTQRQAEGLLKAAERELLATNNIELETRVRQIIAGLRSKST